MHISPCTWVSIWACTHVAPSWAFAGVLLASCPLAARCLLRTLKHTESRSNTMPPPVSTKATDEVSRIWPGSGLELLPPDPDGTTLQTSITIPRAMRPTPRAAVAYWAPEFVPLVLLGLGGVWSLYDMLPNLTMDHGLSLLLARSQQLPILLRVSIKVLVLSSLWKGKTKASDQDNWVETRRSLHQCENSPGVYVISDKVYQSILPTHIVLDLPRWD